MRPKPKVIKPSFSGGSGCLYTLLRVLCLLRLGDSYNDNSYSRARARFTDKYFRYTV